MLIQVIPRDSATYQLECTPAEAAELALRHTVQVLAEDSVEPAEPEPVKPAAKKKAKG